MFSLLQKDFYLFLRSLNTLWEQKKLSIPAKELRRKGITRLEGFVDPLTCEELQQSLDELGETYFSEQAGGKIPDINQILPHIKAIPDEGLKALIQLAAGDRVERFQNCARFRASGGKQTPYRMGRLTPIVFTAYLLIRDMEQKEAPLSLIPGSHRFSLRPYLAYIKHLFSSTKASLIEQPSPKHTKEVSGKRGDLIIINQNTFHSPLPNSTEGTLCHLEFEYMVISRLSYLHQAARESLSRLSDNPYAPQAELQTN